MKTVNLQPINRPFTQYIGADGYAQPGKRAFDEHGNEYIAVEYEPVEDVFPIWDGWLIFREPNDTMWQVGRGLTEDDIEQINNANRT